MDEITVVAQRKETPREAKTRAWFEEQETKAPDNLDGAATHLITLVTGQLTVLFGILALAGDPRPAYLDNSYVKVIGLITIVALWFALLLAVRVIMPSRWLVNRHQPTEQIEILGKILQRKEQHLSASLATFTIGSTTLAILILYILLTTFAP